MRKDLYFLIKDYFRNELLKTRGAKTQEEMAASLCMSVRAYSDLERGKSCCGLITLLLYLVRGCPDREAFLNGLFTILEDFEDKAV